MTMRQSSASASQVKAAPSERPSIGPLADHIIRVWASMASCGVLIGELGATSQTQGEALTVPRWPTLPRS